MPRTARIAPGGMLFHVLNRGNARMRIFDDEADYAAFEKILSEVLPRASMRILAYCLMPNHWHMVLWPEKDGQLAAFMHRLTVTHVRRWHEHRRSTGGGHLYQGTYKSFPVQTDGHFLAVCRYVERNPLRARLVKRAEMWRWGSLWRRMHHKSGDSGLLGDWPVERPRAYLQLVNEPQKPAEQDAIRTCMNRGRPFGAPDWQLATAVRLGLQSTFRLRGRPRKEEK